MDNLSSIDQIELNKFNKSKQEWWDLNGEFSILHQINPLRVKYIKSIILQHFCIDNSSKKPLTGIKILDVGSGGGLMSESLYKLGADVIGIDANAYNTKAASMYAEENKLNIRYINITIEEFVKKEKNKFDIVICLEVIEHVGNLVVFIQNIYKMVKKGGGIIIFSTINRTLKSLLYAIVMGEYILGFIPKNTHKYSKFVKPSELTLMMENSHFILSELKGLKLSLQNKTWELTNDIDVNYFAVFKHNAF